MGDGGRHQLDRAGVDQIAHHLVGDAPLLLNPLARQPRKLRDGLAQPLDQLSTGSDRLKVGLGKVAVVLRGFLAPPRRGVAVLVEMPVFPG